MQKKKKKRAKRTTDWPRMIQISYQSPKYLLNNPHNHLWTSPSCRQNNNLRLITQTSEITVCAILVQLKIDPFTTPLRNTFTLSPGPIISKPLQQRNLLTANNSCLANISVIVKKSSPKNLSADCRSTVGRQLADYRLFVGRQMADRRPTGLPEI